MFIAIYAAKGKWFFGDFDLQGFSFIFSNRFAHLTPSGVMIFEVLRVYGHSLFGTPSGGSIFRCTTKDRGERRAKGVATPFNPPELMRDRILTCFVRTVSQQVI